MWLVADWALRAAGAVMVPIVIGFVERVFVDKQQEFFYSNDGALGLRRASPRGPQGSPSLQCA